MARKSGWSRSISHPGLHKYQVIRASSIRELNNKVEAKMAQWDAQWERQLAAEQRAAERERKAQNAEEAARYAAERTEQAEEAQNVLDTILIDSISQKEAEFVDLKNFAPFTKPAPQKPTFFDYPLEPNPADSKYQPKKSLMSKFSRQKKEASDAESRALYDADYQAWKSAYAEVDKANANLANQYTSDMNRWNQDKEEYEKKQAEENAEIDELQKEFLSGDADAISRFVELAIDSIGYDTYAAADYNPEDQSLILDVFLPALDDIPTLKSVSYVKSKNEFKEAHHPASYLKKKYESVVYQLVLRYIKCVFSLNNGNSPIQSLVLNGRISTVDKATGKPVSPYILSVSISKEAFLELNLGAIDPKAWFKSSRGVSAASIATVTPVAPIVQMSREDKRFIEGYSVESELNPSMNLAAMDWQDFENLIREIFEKEFSVPGGEVKITQASRDGGVDAVAFDPDPIRGGKIVIQAKRYTNTVGVSAVRDLYGTVMNEGAMKGILVTTANFGNDAYEFAQGKPLTLMNGANLLYLLEKHGHQAKIDLQEAKALLSE